jgi:TRAP-type C4-dicarboxylate transport system substrate-binding protein
MSFFRAALLGGFVAVAAGVSAQAPAEAATKYCDGPKITWKDSLWGKRRSVTEGAEYVSKYVKDATCGNFNIKLYYGEQLSKAKENLDAIKVGAIEAAFVCSSYHPGKVRALSVLDLPFLPIQDLDVLAAVHTRLNQTETFKKDLGKWGAIWYMSNLLPQYEYMGRGTPPKSVSDFKGKRLRALGGMGDAARAIGAVPTTMPASETYTALQRGTVDAIGFPFTYTFAAFKLDEIADWYTTNMSLGSPNCFTVFSEKAYEKLPEQYKTILKEAVPGAYDALKADYKKKDEINLPKWAKNKKLTAVTFSEDELEDFRKVGGKPVWDAWIKENQDRFNAQELFDLVMKTAKEAKAN